MSHIPIIVDGSTELIKIASDYGAVDANIAAGVYSADQLPKIQEAQAKILEQVDQTCEKLKAARLKFQEKCNIPEPD